MDWISACIVYVKGIMKYAKDKTRFYKKLIDDCGIYQGAETIMDYYDDKVRLALKQAAPSVEDAERFIELINGAISDAICRVVYAEPTFKGYSIEGVLPTLKNATSEKDLAFIIYDYMVKWLEKVYQC